MYHVYEHVATKQNNIYHLRTLQIINPVLCTAIYIKSCQ